MRLQNQHPTLCQILRRIVFVFIPIALCASSVLAADIAGFTEPTEDSTLGLSENGRITQILVHEGDRVEQGQLLLSLDQDLERLECQRRQILRDSLAEIESTQLQVKILEKQLQGTKELFQSTGSISTDELENRELEYAFANAELLRLKTAKKREAIEYETAQQQLRKRNLYAPFSGNVAELLVGVGENCELDTALVRLVDSTEQLFVANLELALSQHLTIGQQVHLTFNNTDEPITIPAKLSFISPVIDPASGLRTIKAKFKNSHSAILPGSAGMLRIEEELASHNVTATDLDTAALSAQ